MIIIGHRGARNEAPENTLVGFQHLRNIGIHHVELDVRLSADHELVVIHDASVDRTTNAAGPVSHFSAMELAKLDATCRFRPDHNQPITPTSPVAFLGVPRLAEVIKQWPELESIQLEVKTTDTHSLKIIADGLAELIHDHSIQQQATITSMDIRLLRDLQHRYPRLARGYVAERFIRNPIDTACRLDCQLLAINWRRLSEPDVIAAQRAGLTVSAWTVNDRRVAERLRHWGVDSLITDCPLRMRDLGQA